MVAGVIAPERAHNSLISRSSINVDGSLIHPNKSLAATFAASMQRYYTTTMTLEGGALLSFTLYG